MNESPSILRVEPPWLLLLAQQVRKIGANRMVALATAMIVTLSVAFTSFSLVVFQGYIDLLGIGICIGVPLLIFPLPAKIFFSMFLKLQEAEEELRAKNLSLENALCQVKTLSGLLPICCSCKKIRDDNGYWNELEHYFSEHSDLQLSHGFCPECVERLYPELHSQP